MLLLQYEGPIEEQFKTLQSIQLCFGSQHRAYVSYDSTGWTGLLFPTEKNIIYMLGITRSQRSSGLSPTTVFEVILKFRTEQPAVI